MNITTTGGESDVLEKSKLFFRLHNLSVLDDIACVNGEVKVRSKSYRPIRNSKDFMLILNGYHKVSYWEHKS